MNGDRMTELMQGKIDHRKIAASYKSQMEKRGYRADMIVEGQVSRGMKKISVRIGFDSKMGRPTDQQVESLVASKFPGHDIDWSTASFDEHGFVATIRPRVDRIPVESTKNIPAGFVRVAAATYTRKQADSFSVWQLEKGGEGLELVRVSDESVQPESTVLPAVGRFVHTPDGDGIIASIKGSKVQVRAFDGTEHEHELKAVNLYKPEEEKSKLIEYYTKAYGDPEYARKLVYGE